MQIFCLQVYKFAFLCQNIYHLFVIKVISCSNISACIFLKIFFMFEYKCMHVFWKTKCIFKYKRMHVYVRGYDKDVGPTGHWSYGPLMGHWSYRPLVLW